MGVKKSPGCHNNFTQQLIFYCVISVVSNDRAERHERRMKSKNRDQKSYLSDRSSLFLLTKLFIKVVPPS